jgi:hypothetical protein
MTAFQTFTSGQILTAAQVTTLQANSTAVAIFEEHQTSGTAGGAATSAAWTKRTLNTTIVNGITACSIASSVITLTAGTYFVEAVSTFYRTDVNQLRLRNTTAGTNLVLGMTAFGSSGGVTAVNPYLKGYFTLTGSTNIELQYYMSGASVSANDQGVAGTWGTNVYSTLTIQQVA